MTDHKVASREEWLAAREALLAREKEHTRMGDDLARQRRELPWVRVEKEYSFEANEGIRTLAELFDGRSQLLVYHFMFGPSYEAGCPTCSSSADAVNGVLPHLNARDVTMVYVSRAPLEKLLAYKRRMGWSFPWVSSASSEFNFDFRVSRTEEQTREAFKPMIDAGIPPIVDHLGGPGLQHLRPRRGCHIPRLLHHGPRAGVSDGVLPNPRPRPQGSRRSRLASLASPARRVCAEGEVILGEVLGH